MRRPRLAVLALFVALPACAQQPPQTQPAPAAPGQVMCTEPRRTACTFDYRPVCGTKRDGTRQTYGNACTACADQTVVSHIPGPCS